MQQINQKGFTLFEIAFAVVIISLLATIMVMGQNFTVNSQVNRLEHDFRSIQTAIYDTQDVLRSKHGDVHKVSLHLQDSAALGNNGNLNGNIDGNWSSTSGENFKLWQIVRPGSFAQGLTDTKLNVHVPLKLPGGVIGVTEAHDALIAGLSGNYTICTNNIAGQLVKKLDLVMDDGNTATGSMRVSNSVGGSAIATDGIVNSSTYMVCLGV
jgi:prepilin-type N-terminal cleavage/methylation domain-containing protein